AVLLRLLVVDLDVPLQARGWLGHREGVDLVARGPTNRALARHRLPYLRMRLLHRLWEHADLLQGRGRGHDRATHRVHVGGDALAAVRHAPPRFAHAEVGDGRLVVPLGVPGRQRPELAVVSERRLRPGLHDDLEGFFEIGAIALLILDGRAVAPAPGFSLA